MQAVIFDLDGTLLDVREAFYVQFEELSRHYDGVAATREQIAAAAHGTTEAIVRALVQNTRASFDEICALHQDLRLKAIDAHFTLYDGVADLLKILKNMGIKVAAVTAGNQLTVDCLQRGGIHEYFDTIIDARDVQCSKPDPEGVHLALSKLGVATNQAVMVGDTAADILVGKNAGLAKTVGVSHGFGRVEALQAAGADHIIHNISSLLDVLE